MIDDLLSNSPVAGMIFAFLGLAFMIYGFGLAVMLLLSWMGDRPLRPIIAYSLTTIGAIAFMLPVGQWWITIPLVLIGAACTALHLFALTGRRIPDASVEDAPSDVDDDEADSG